MRRGLILFASIFILIAASFGFFLNSSQSNNLHSVPVKEEKTIKDLILADLPSQENIDQAEIIFEKIKINGSSADVGVVLKWGPRLCLSYHYRLSKSSGTWRVILSEKTTAC